MTTSSRACDAPDCTLSATIEPAGPGGLARVAWSDGTEELLRGLPPDGSIRCRPHRPGSRWSHRCSDGFTHSTVEEARSCAGHGDVGQPPAAWGLHVAGPRKLP